MSTERIERRGWTKTEDAAIKRYYLKKGAIFTGKKLGRSQTSIQDRALRLGISGSKRRWNAFEIRYLKSRLGRVSPEAIARTLHRTPAAVRMKIIQLRLRATTLRMWTEKETTYLLEHYHKVPNWKIAVTLRRTPASVEMKAKRLGILHHVPRLPRREAQYAIARIGKTSFVKIAQHLKVSVSTIRTLAKHSGYDRGSKWRLWTLEEDALVRKLWGTMKRAEVAARLGREVLPVAARAQKLGVTKPVATQYRRTARRTTT